MNSNTTKADNDHTKDSWNEFNDPEIVDWKRIRLSIEHENTLTNARVTWLLYAQGFLLGAYILLFSSTVISDFAPSKLHSVQWVLFTIVLAGVLVSFYLSRGIKAAYDQHKHLAGWWMDRIGCEKGGKGMGQCGKHPNICGYDPKFIVTIQYYWFPFIFLPLWLILGFVPFMDVLVSNQEQLQKHFSTYGPYIIVSVIFCVIGYWIARLKHKNND
ncbi:MAG: hypothetical protein M0036_12040 [Desulfobacteraceae bacterium]|nr:hypothetical protein [Desulfobacteraceae bacterium]